MGKEQLKLDYIRAEFEKCGYTLLTAFYINCDQRLEYLCTKGHRHRINWSNWKKGVRCPYCKGQGKPDINQIKSFFESEGYVLLSDEYVGDSGKLWYECPEGHVHAMRWANFRHGKRCPECSKIKQNLQISGSNHYNWMGGISCEPYCDAWADKEYKESIKERDGFMCQNPNCSKIGSRLTIHHIDYNKKHCEPKNLITLCNSCNIKANRDRELHQSFYTNIISGKLRRIKVL
jgi:hypothetical protein